MLSQALLIQICQQEGVIYPMTNSMSEEYVILWGMDSLMESQPSAVPCCALMQKQRVRM